MGMMNSSCIVIAGVWVGPTNKVSMIGGHIKFKVGSVEITPLCGLYVQSPHTVFRGGL